MNITFSGLIDALDNPLIGIASTKQVESEFVEGFGIYPIPTFISICPYCKTENKWRTTGVIVPHKCEQCNKYFKVW